MEASDSSLILQARPAPRAGHFDVHPSDRPLTVPEEPVFSLETRSAARQQFDAAMAAKQQLLEVISTVTPLQEMAWGLLPFTTYQ